MYSGTFCILISLLQKICSFQIEVKVKQGTVIGISSATIFENRIHYVFYRVPYAQPPIGKLRFKDPMSIKNWKRPVDGTTEYHGACAQAHIVHKYALYGIEDCLYMNIYTPKLPKNKYEDLKAVVVWIHGYSFTSSFSHIFGADFLIDNDVLFVSVTHRLGVFGFLKVNEYDHNANMGLKDIVMALNWIRKHIKQFGGDKKKITVMGNGSAGSFLSLLLMTKYRRLFSKLILQSGGIFSPSLIQGNHVVEKARLQAQLKEMDSDDIMKASTKDIIKAAMHIYNHKDVINSQKPLIPFSPIIETKSHKSLIITTPEEFYSMHRGNLNVSLLVGFNTQESISEVIPFLRNPILLKSFSPLFKFMVPFSSTCGYNYTLQRYKEIAEKIKKKYFKHGISEKSTENFLRYVSDLHKYPIYKFIKTHLSKSHDNMYVYKFNYIGKFNSMKATSIAGVSGKVKGTAAGDEMCYILKCEPLWESYKILKTQPKNRDYIFIREITKLWANFVKTGHPTPFADQTQSFVNNTSNIKWPLMTLERDNVLLIGSSTFKLINSNVENKLFSFWNKLYKDYYSDKKCNHNNRDEL